MTPGKSALPAYHSPPATNSTGSNVPGSVHDGVPSTASPTLEIPTPVSLAAAHQFVTLIKENPCFIILATVFRAVRKRWLIALTGASLLTALAIFTIWYFMPPSKFTARALLQFDLIPSGVAESPHQQYYLANLTSFQKTQAALIRSRTVLQAALAKAELRNLELLQRQADPLAFLETQIHADFGISPEIMRVTMSGQEGQALQTIVHAVVQAYLAEVAHKEHAQLRSELERIKDLIARYDEKIRAKQTRLRELEQAAGSGQVQTLEIFLRGYLEQLDRSRRELAAQAHTLRQLQAELKALQPKLTLAKMVLGSSENVSWYLKLAIPCIFEYLVPSAQVELRLCEEPQFAEKKRELQRLEAELDAACALLSPNLSKERRAALLKTKHEAIYEARVQLEELARRLRPMVRRQLIQEVALATEQRVRELRDKHVQLTGLVAHLQEEVEHLERLIASLKRSHLDLQWLKEEIEADQQVAKRLAARKDQLEILCESPTRVRLFEDAVILPAYDNKQRWLYITIAIAGALTFWMAGLVAWECRTQPIYGPEVLAGKVSAPVLASLPHTEQFLCLRSEASDPNKPLPLAFSRFVESVDALRTLLIHLLQHEYSQVIMVSSAVQGEGKTSLSCHLAASLARASRRTLLVDTDLRRPRAHKLLATVQDPGLSEVLHAQLDWRQAIQSEIIPHLDFLPAGASVHTGVRLLSQDYFLKLLETWRNDYDFIILDSSPVLLVADPLSIVQGVDAVILSTMYKVSTLPRTQIAYQRLVAVGARVLGIVVNGISPRQYDYYYGAYHYYYNSHSPNPTALQLSGRA
ncbi:Tyrosine-protein kinase wzc [bacterium HR36]|nr:Tyrosine-protein kinase wzc [bacterium HR36]